MGLEPSEEINVVASAEAVEVYVVADAECFAVVGKLPNDAIAVARFIAVVGNPKFVVVESVSVEVLAVVVVVSVDYWFYFVVLFNFGEPFTSDTEYFSMVARHCATVDFEVEYRWHVARNQRCVCNEVLRLFFAGRVWG